MPRLPIRQQVDEEELRYRHQDRLQGRLHPVKGDSPYSSSVYESVKYWGGPATLKAGKRCVKYQAVLWSKNEVNKATGGRIKSWGNCG